MKLNHFLLITIFFFLIILGCNKTEKQDICGAWHMTSGSYEGPNISVKADEHIRISYKVLSENHFAVVETFVSNPESLFYAAVGTYELNDSLYVEHYQASNFGNKVGQTLTYHSKVVDDKWIITLLEGDMSLKETWCCIKK